MFPNWWNERRLNVEFSPSRGHRRSNAFANLPIDIPRIERWLAGKQFVNRRAQRVDVAQVGAALAIQLLWAHVNERAAPALLHG